MAPPKRYNTVYDLTALRLHADGSRARVGGRYAPVQDIHGNVLALDAGGRPDVERKRRPLKGRARSRRSDRSASSRTGSARSEDSDDSLGSDDGARDAWFYRDLRAQMRHDFNQDLSFLDAPDPTSALSEEFRPSSDLLKYIHHFACEFYTRRGELFYPTALKRRKKGGKASLAPSDQEANAQRELSGVDDAESTNVGSGDDVREGSTVNGDEDATVACSDDSEAAVSDFQPSDAADEPGTASKTVPKNKRNRTIGRLKRHGSRHMKKKRDPALRNMYQAFDGTVLYALGILLHEHIAALLEGPGVASPTLPSRLQGDAYVVDSEASASTH